MDPSREVGSRKREQLEGLCEREVNSIGLLDGWQVQWKNQILDSDLL